LYIKHGVALASSSEVTSGIQPKRSILFLAVTAEEKGLVGADYFAQNSTLAKTNLVADVNLDTPVITYDASDVVAS
jgi:Zn-dependent M28 family amino/carboxypeptidase